MKENAEIIAIAHESRRGKRSNNRISISDTIVARLTPPKRVARGTKKVKLPRDRIYDTQVEGFFIRITPKGTKTWKLRYKTKEGVDTEYTIGTFPRIRTQLARQEARKKLAESTLGVNINQQKKQLRDNQSLEIFATQYVEKQEINKKSYKMSKQIFNAIIIPYFKKTKLVNITKGQIKDWHSSMAKTPYQGNRAKSLLHAMFEYAVDHKATTGVLTNPCSNIKNFPEYSREDFFKTDELEVLKQVLELYYKKHPLPTNFFKLVGATGRRPAEVYTLKWSEIDWENQQVTQKTKTGQLTFPLSDNAIVILRDIQRMSGNYIWVFSKMAFNDQCKKRDQVEDTYWKTYKYHWNKIRKRTGYDYPTYILRHTFGTHYTKQNKNIALTQRAMGHKNIATTMRYTKVLDEDVRKGIDETTTLAF
tara:strand:+ start:178 stop:1437 length:1260 start_codon:yes stop_codon:yes gene_type:complete